MVPRCQALQSSGHALRPADASRAISDEMKEQLKRYRFSLDPVAPAARYQRDPVGAGSSIRFRRSGSCWRRKPGEVLGSPSQPVARRGSPAYTQRRRHVHHDTGEPGETPSKAVVRGAVWLREHPETTAKDCSPGCV